MSNEIVIVRTGISLEQLDKKYADDLTRLHEIPEGLRTLAVLGKTFYWPLNLERFKLVLRYIFTTGKETNELLLLFTQKNVTPLICLVKLKLSLLLTLKQFVLKMLIRLGSLDEILHFMNSDKKRFLRSASPPSLHQILKGKK